MADNEHADGEEFLNQEEIEEILSVDPFKDLADEQDKKEEELKAKEDGADETDDTSDEETDETEEVSTEDSTDGDVEVKPEESKEEPEKVEAPDPRDLEIAALKQQLGTLENAMKAVTAKEEPTEKKEPENKLAELQKLYSFTVPSELMDALNSEEPADRQKGVSALLQGVGVAVHQQVMKAVEQTLETKMTQVSQQSDMRSKQQELHDDFYGKFPGLKPFQALVQQVGAQMANETGTKQWSPEFRDALGVRVMRMLEEQASALGYVKPEKGKENGTAKRKGPPKQLSSSSRPGSQTSKEPEANSEVDILESLDLA